MSPRRSAAALLSVALLTSCATSSVVPDALLEPSPCPAVPPAGASDNMVGRFILELDACAQSRGGQIEAIAEIVRPKGGR